MGDFSLQRLIWLQEGTRPFWVDYGGLMGFNGDYRGSINQKTGMLVDIPSGKLPHNELENHHAIDGKTHYKWPFKLVHKL